MCVEKGSGGEPELDKKDIVSHTDRAAALDLTLKYLEQQDTATPTDVMFKRRWQNFASTKRLSSLRQQSITHFMFKVQYTCLVHITIYSTVFTHLLYVSIVCTMF